MSSILTDPLMILELGNPDLRRSSHAIADVNDDRVQQLCDRLLTIVKEANGVGIAAPQVGELVQILVVASRPNLRYPNAPTMEPIVLINPTILSQSDETEKGWEGCLSVPGIRGLVPRYTQIEVAYTGRDGKRIQQTFTDFVARIFQHEWDHLQGKVFLDRVEAIDDLMTEQEFQKQMMKAL